MKKKTVRLVLEPGLITRLDAQAKAESISRSALLRKIGRSFLTKQINKQMTDEYYIILI